MWQPAKAHCCPHEDNTRKPGNRARLLCAHVRIICLCCCMPYLDALAATFCMAYSTRDSAEFASAFWPPSLVCAPAGCLALACKGLLVTSHKMATAGAPWVAFACASVSCHLAPCHTQISLECLVAVLTIFTSTDRNHLCNVLATKKG